MRLLSCVLALSSLLIAGCAGLRGHRSCSAVGGESWREFRSEHFILRTDLPPLDARVVVERLEHYRAGLALAWGPQFDPPGKVTAIVFRERDALAEFLPADTDGIALRTDRGVLLVFAAVRGGGPSRTWLARTHLHELAHYLSSYALLRQPRWLQEGLATFLENTEFSSSGTVRLGKADLPSYEALSRWRVLPLERLWEWDTSAAVTDTHHQYASAWAWVHFLMNAHPVRFGEFQRRLALAEDPRTAWSEAFAGLTDTQLERDLHTYLFSGTFKLIQLRVAPPSFLRITEHPLGDDAQHALRAELIARLGEGSAADRAGRVSGELAVGEQHVPGSPRLGVARFTLGLEPLTLAAARRLAERHPADAAVLQLYARVLPPEERIAPLRAALKAAPEDPQLLNDLAFALVITAARGSEALRLSEEAVELAPWNAEYVDTYARALLAAGRCEEAVRQQQRAMDVVAERATPEQREVLRRRIEATRGRCEAGSSR